MSKIKSISLPTLRRLPTYCNLLRRLNANHIKTVSSNDIGEELNLTPIQVRKDLSALGIIGRPKTGYAVDVLLDALEGFLGWNNINEAFLVGTGHLGTSLLGYNGFAEYGLNIVAAFDNDPVKIGTKLFDKPVFDVSKLDELIRRMKISIVILTVPGDKAQEIADIAVKAGAKAIWNFSPAHLIVPENIILQHENLAASLAIMTKKIRSL